MSRADASSSSSGRRPIRAWRATSFGCCRSACSLPLMRAASPSHSSMARRGQRLGRRVRRCCCWWPAAYTTRAPADVDAHPVPACRWTRSSCPFAGVSLVALVSGCDVPRAQCEARCPASRTEPLTDFETAADMATRAHASIDGAHRRYVRLRRCSRCTRQRASCGSGWCATDAVALGAAFLAAYWLRFDLQVTTAPGGACRRAVLLPDARAAADAGLAPACSRSSGCTTRIACSAACPSTRASSTRAARAR